jgi:hypothetical protein
VDETAPVYDTNEEASVHKTSHNAAHGDAQAAQPSTNDRTDDVAAYIARHGVTVCPAGKRTPGLAKPVSNQRQRPDTVAAALCWAWRRLPKKKKPDLGWMRKGRVK